MKIGFVGAGKVGFSLGRYMTERNVCVSGYYSQHPESAAEASKFTQTQHFRKLDDLLSESDAVFLTVPDGAIGSVWNALKEQRLQGKYICHCSGSLSSAVFSGIERTGASGYSIHPLFAVSDRLRSYQDLSNAYFTIEGPEPQVQMWADLFAGMGNQVRIISAADKCLYHAAAVFVSNLVIGLYESAVRILADCGFDHEGANEALRPLFLHNAISLAGSGSETALTGPVERADVQTVAGHLSVLRGREREVYIGLSEVLAEIAGRKHPDRDYGELLRVLGEARMGE